MSNLRIDLVAEINEQVFIRLLVGDKRKKTVVPVHNLKTKNDDTTKI